MIGSRPLLATTFRLLAFLACTLLTASASAGTLQGQLVDSLTETPISGATVRVLGTNEATTTDARGQWSFELPQGEYELEFEKQLGSHHYHFRVVNQHVPQYKPADSWIATPYFINRGVPRVDAPLGAPTSRIDHPSNRDRGPVDLDPLLDDGPTHRPGGLTLPKDPPTTIRVARRDDKSTCRNSPIVAIEEVPLEDYAKGVLHPEIGVFKSLSNVSEVYKAFAAAAKSYGLYFMLVYGPGNRRTVSSAKPPNGYTWFHIDDTPCNQRYSDKRSINSAVQAAEAMKGKILVKKGAPDELDKYEYAASCKEHGTRPEYQQKIVDDSSPAHSCVGNWCGHDTCAGHQDHPHVPGNDDCLVRGICQWGAAEWAEGGKDHKWLLSHYQPNLELRDIDGSTQPETVELTGYVYRDTSDIMGTGIAGASVELGDGRTTTTDQNGVYTFDSVEVSLGTVTVTASKSGYQTNSRSKKLQTGMTNWNSIQLKPVQTNRDTGTEPEDTSSPADTSAPQGDARPRIADAPSGDDDDTSGTQTGADAGPPRGAGGLGPLVGRSQGVSSSGCSSPDPQKEPSRRTLVVGLAVLGLLLVRRMW